MKQPEELLEFNVNAGIRRHDFLIKVDVLGLRIEEREPSVERYPGDPRPDKGHVGKMLIECEIRLRYGRRGPERDHAAVPRQIPVPDLHRDLIAFCRIVPEADLLIARIPFRHGHNHVDILVLRIAGQGLDLRA